MKYLKIFLKYLLITFVLSWVASFFFLSRLVDVPNPSSATLDDPVQSTLTGSKNIGFDNSEYSYKLKPLYDYEISGVVVHKINYGLLYTGPDKTAPYDMCIVWGNNVKEKTYLSDQISFSQDQRFCWYRYKGALKFYPDQLSNNHLIVNKDEILKKIGSINVGDEIVIKGKLVNLSATKKNSSSSAEVYNWNSSTTREDTRNGACEVIYVESVSITNSAHPIASIINKYSPWGVFILIILNVCLFLYEISVRQKMPY